VASTCDHVLTACPTSPTNRPQLTSFHATNHATPLRTGAVPHCWTASPSRQAQARSVERGASSTECVSARQRSRCPRSPGQRLPRRCAPPPRRPARGRQPGRPPRLADVPGAFGVGHLKRVSKYDRLKTVADETLRRSHPPSRHDREGRSPRPQVPTSDCSRSTMTNGDDPLGRGPSRGRRPRTSRSLRRSLSNALDPRAPPEHADAQAQHEHQEADRHHVPDTRSCR
jgi:hypothetical protein